MTKRPRSQQGDDHMEFLLTLRRRGIADQTVLRAMDEVPREYFVTAVDAPPTSSRGVTVLNALSAGATRITLGEGDTPLLLSRHIGPAAGMKNLFFKLETVNPTGSYKARFAASTV